MQSRPQFVALLVAIALVGAACSGGSSDSAESATGGPTPAVAEATAPPSTPTAAIQPTPAPEPLRVNDLRVLGSHNSYHLRPEPAVMAAITGISAGLAESIDYSHRPLGEQLEQFGVRQVEIDVFFDPDGGLYANRQALPVLGLPAASGLAELDAPGFKVLHTQDFDFGTNCLTLQLCLAEIVAWSDGNPTHLPIMVLIEIKDESVPDAAAAGDVDLPDLGVAWTQPLPIDTRALDDLDAELVAALGRERLLTPDDVRGDAATLEAVILADGWPTVDEARGKVMVMLNNGGDVRDLYIADAPTLEGRIMFSSSSPGNADAAFVQLSDPIADADQIAELAAAGYLIRTRTDVPTEDARSGNTARRDAAIESGAHFLSTDYYEPDPAFASGYVVELDDLCNPITAPATCDIEFASAGE